MTVQSTVDQLLAYGVVPVIRTSTPDLARTSVEWLAEAGFNTFEITMTIPDACRVIRACSAREGVLIGAGTVLDPADVHAVIAAGARYVVSPCLVPDVAAACRDHGVPCLMGALTPSEVHQARKAGASVVKIFPASSVGPGHLKALRSVFPDIPFMPTGGIDSATVGDWIKAGAACVGVGGKLVDEKLIQAGRREEIVSLGRTLRAAFGAARAAA